MVVIEHGVLRAPVSDDQAVVGKRNLALCQDGISSLQWCRRILHCTDFVAGCVHSGAMHMQANVCHQIHVCGTYLLLCFGPCPWIIKVESAMQTVAYCVLLCLAPRPTLPLIRNQ